ncbi:MAG: PadR family transcriptional regulator [Solirubrobacterales bacterium]|nr:PadR family transcriptional regulator [Solirubrobacterales bacterium]
MVPPVSFGPNHSDRTVFSPAMSEARLSPTSYVVLGLVETMQPATPYEMKRAAASGVSQIWSLPHTQLYSESARLAKLGYVDEQREPGGRRRRIYRLTPQGSRALDAWRDETTTELYELRDAGLLRLFFGADPRRLAPVQLEAHERKLRAYEELRRSGEGQLPEAARLTLDAGIGHEREYIRFWSGLRGGAER